jgi:hypothetical protein
LDILPGSISRFTGGHKGPGDDTWGIPVSTFDEAWIYQEIEEGSVANVLVTTKSNTVAGETWRISVDIRPNVGVAVSRRAGILLATI